MDYPLIRADSVCHLILIRIQLGLLTISTRNRPKEILSVLFAFLLIDGLVSERLLLPELLHPLDPVGPDFLPPLLQKVLFLALHQPLYVPPVVLPLELHQITESAAQTVYLAEDHLFVQTALLQRNLLSHYLL
jgi:hypothetical protein